MQVQHVCSALLVSDLTLEDKGFDNVTMRVIIVSSTIIVAIVALFPVTVDMMMRAAYDGMLTDKFKVAFDVVAHSLWAAFDDVMMVARGEENANVVIHGTDAFDEFEAAVHIGKAAFVDTLEAALGDVLVAKLRRAVDASSYDSLRAANCLLWAAHVSVLADVDTGTMMAFPEGSIHVLRAALDDMFAVFDGTAYGAASATCLGAVVAFAAIDPGAVVNTSLKTLCTTDFVIVCHFLRAV